MGQAARAPDAERETILIVEDDLSIATLERRCLGRHGYGVVCATDAEEALARIDEGDIGLVVLDHGLPGGTTGLELYERMKASGRDLPVVMVTGQSSEETVVEALRLGVRDFITKSPDYLDYLPGAVEAAVAQSRLARRLERSEERFRGLIENLQVGVVLAGPDGEILVSNRAAANLLGFGGTGRWAGASSRRARRAPSARTARPSPPPSSRPCGPSPAAGRCATRLWASVGRATGRG